MIQVKDSDNNRVRGVFKDRLGNVIINNNDEYNRYKREQKHMEEFNTMKSDIEFLKETLNKILSK